MIFVLFPPGCYGSYIGKSLYYYTDLSPNTNIEFQFDQNGSSHSVRQDTELKKKIRVGHQLPDNYSQVVSILPVQSHHLDYFNNQFAKNSNFDLNEYLKVLIAQSEVSVKLNSWGLNSDTLDSAPQWVLREFFSFWLADCFADGYKLDCYSVGSSVSLSTNDIFQDFYNTILNTSHALGLTIKVDKKQIESNHAAFLKSQLFHNSQLNCMSWVNTIIDASSTSCQSPCQTIFDEAYVQHLLRETGYQLRCDSLNIFPSSSAEMQSLIYKQ
jgi:hypothetical protein